VSFKEKYALVAQDILARISLLVIGMIC